jgi:lipopolysaccharide export system permease protein
MIGPTLGRYLSLRFTKTILAVFGTIFLLIYLIDFVEMLRRSGDIPGVTTAYVALLTLMRVPSVSEQVLPFATLGGAMVAFLGLTRKLELVVARAAGVSVWQFLAPPVLIVLLLGIFSITVYNPVSAHLKQRADLIETKWFGQAGRSGSDPGLWIRQRSIDGQAIIRAEQSSAKGTQLGSVTAFVYDLDGRFKERIEAATATLAPGVWTLDDARIFTASQEPRTDPHYLLSTNLTPEQVTQSFVSPDAVPFWSLLDLSRRTEAAGLDATAYRLRFQALLARPLLLVAMVLIAAAFSLRFFRFGGISKMVSGGVGAGFVLYVATKVVSDLGGAGLLSAPVAAWSPALVGSMLGALVLLHQEDG